ncbi:hypothetical protein K1719_005408 [Acacia pycnantha]|nr:hypothetical protein K1719_005408 [Acacia pycnantha]
MHVIISLASYSWMRLMPLVDGRRFSEGTSADREIQRTLMELLNQLDGFDQLGKVKMIMATSRPDVALLRPGRLDCKIEIPLPNELSRMEILKIHAAGTAKHGEIDYEAIVKLAGWDVCYTCRT